MNENLFDHVNIDKKNTYVPNGVAKDLAQETKAYDQRIEDFGGIDLQVLGIGIDGHIGFNEPEDCFTAETHVVTLDPSTIDANARFFSSKDEVPGKAPSPAASNRPADSSASHQLPQKIPAAAHNTSRNWV